MRVKILMASATLALLPVHAFASSVSIGGNNPQVCTVSNTGSATVNVPSATLASLDGGAAVTLDLGRFDLYCNVPATLTMSSINGALTNPIDTTGFNDNGIKKIPYTLQVFTGTGSFNTGGNENFDVPGGHAAGLTGGQSFRKTKTAVNGITLDYVDFKMNLNNDKRPTEQVAAKVMDTRFLYAGDFSETTTLTIAPAL